MTVNGRKIGLLGAVPSDLAGVASPGPNVIVNPAGSTEDDVRVALAGLLNQHPDCNIVIFTTGVLMMEICLLLARLFC